MCPSVAEAMQKRDILIAVDAQSDVDYFINALQEFAQLDGHFRHVTTTHELETALKAQRWDLILGDFQLAAFSSLTAVQLAHTLQPQTPFIFTFAEATVADAVEMMRAGARGFVARADRQRLGEMIRQELQNGRSANQPAAAEPEALVRAAQYQSIVDNQTELICRYDAHFRLTFVNRAYSEWQRQTPQELLGANILERIPAAERERAAAHVRALTIDNPAAISIHHAIMPDGSERLIEWTDQALFDSDGRLLEYQGSGRDVTERERSVQQLRAVKSDLELYRGHLQGMLDTMQDAVISYSLVDQRLIFASASIEHVFGYPMQRFLDDPEFFVSIVHPDDLEQAMTARQICLRDGFAEFEHRIFLPDGQTRWLHRRAWVNYDENGRALRVNDSASDITRRKQIEEALRASEEKYRSLIESSDAAISLVDAEGNYLYLNRISAMPFGLPPEALTGKTVHELFPADQADAILRDVRRVIAHDTGMTLETEVTLAGKSSWFRTSIQPVRDGDGKPYAALIHAGEITEKKLTEQAIRQQNEILQQSRDFISLATTDGRVIYINKGGAALMGVDDPALLIGKAIGDFRAPEEAERIARFALPLAIENGQWRGESQLRTVDGRILDVDQTIFPVRDENGRVLRYATILSDITERKQTETALRDSEQQFQQFMRRLPGAVFIKDNAGRTIYCNDLYAQMSGNTAQEIIGRHSDEYLPAEIAEPFNRENAQVLAENRAIDFNHSFPAPGGMSHWLTIKFPIPRENQPPLLGAISLNVTEEKQTEAALRQSEGQLRAIFDAIPDLMFGFKPDGTFISYHAPDPNMLALPPEQFIGRKPAECLPPEVAHKLLDAIDKVIATEEIAQFEYDLIVQGVVSNFEARLAPAGDGELLALIRDVTARTQAETALQEAHDLLERRVIERTAELERVKNRLEAIFNHSGDGILRLDIHQGIQQANYAFDMLFAMTPDNYLGRPLSDFFPSQDAAHIAAIVQEVAQTHRLHHVEAQAMRANGDGFDVEMSLAPVNRAETAVTNLVCIIRDISQRKRAEEALRRSEERLKMTLQGTRAGTWEWNVQTGVATFNDRWAEIVGYTLAELSPISVQTWIDLAHPDDLTLSNHLLERHFSGELAFYDCETRMKHKEGHWVWVEDRGMVVEWGQDGQPLRMLGTHIDITERKLAESFLRESEARYRLLAENVLDVIMKLSPEMTITYITPSCYNQLGYTPEELIGRSGFEIVHPDDLAHSGRVVMEAVQSGATFFALVERIKHKDGHYIWAETTNTIVRDPATGAVVEFIGLAHNITERKHADDALRESEARYQSVVQTQSELICRYLPDLTLTFVNNAYCRYFNARPEELIGRSFLELIPEAQHADVRAFHEELMRTKQSAVYEHQVIRPDGSLRWQFWTDTAVVDENGGVVTVQSVGLDITERKQAEDALRASEEKFRQFVEDAPIATIIADQSGVIVLVNKEAERLFGYNRAELIGQAIESLVPKEMRQSHVADRGTFASAPVKPRMNNMELLACRKDGRVFPVDIQLSYIDVASLPLVMCFITDITERKQAEEALKLALAQEKELSELKSRFVSMTSHEFRTPLAVILTTTELLSTYRDRMDEAQIDARLAKIRHQVSHMKDIMENVLQLARSQAGRLEFKPAQGDLWALCLEIIEEYDSQAEHRGRLVYECANAPATAVFDPRLMRQVIGNLVSNALKYSAREKPVHVCLVQNGDQMILSVRDEGIGIPHNDLKRLFEPFHRAANVGEISGTGLGLNIARQAIELHGGTIALESQLQQGTTFTVTFPQNPPAGSNA
jgi:PAS domain S-box-containing protein